MLRTIRSTCEDHSEIINVASCTGFSPAFVVQCATITGSLGMRKELGNKAIAKLYLWVIDVLYCMMKGVI